MVDFPNWNRRKWKLAMGATVIYIIMLFFIPSLQAKEAPLRYVQFPSDIADVENWRFISFVYSASTEHSMVTQHQFCERFQICRGVRFSLNCEHLVFAFYFLKTSKHRRCTCTYHKFIYKSEWQNPQRA